MGQMVFGLVLLGVAFFLRLGASAVREGGRPVGNVLRLASLAALVVGILVVVGSTAVVINAGEVGVQHAFGTVNGTPLLAGIRMVPPWSSIERYSTREEQYPFLGDQVEEIHALSSRWK
jgi:regulator of protease activity HflC (stomatin/prohibitin superfamily)